MGWWVSMGGRGLGWGSRGGGVLGGVGGQRVGW